MLASSRARNRREGITGLLVHDQGQYFQWLEGPPAALERLWASIQNDRRHAEIELLGEPRLPMRLFADWEMRLAVRSADAEADEEDVITVAPELLMMLARQHAGSPGALAALASLSSTACADLACSALTAPHHQSVRRLAESVVRGLAQRMPELQRAAPTARSCEPLSDPEAPVVQDDLLKHFARQLVAQDGRAARATFDQFRASGFGAAALGAWLLAPTARLLGDLWQADACNVADLTVGICRLAAMTRDALDGTPPVTQPFAPTVLIARPPGEPDVLGPSLAATQLEPIGCVLGCDFSESGEALLERLAARHFDVIVLALDPLRPVPCQTPEAFAAMVSRLREASLNPALSVVACGRMLADAPELGPTLGADAWSGQVSDLGRLVMERACA
jgi:hypothetical protein